MVLCFPSWFELLRCKLCGSRGTHRKCSSLELHCSTWVCDDCSATVDGTGSLNDVFRSNISSRGAPVAHRISTCTMRSYHNGLSSTTAWALCCMFSPLSVSMPFLLHYNCHLNCLIKHEQCKYICIKCLARSPYEEFFHLGVGVCSLTCSTWRVRWLSG